MQKLPSERSVILLTCIGVMIYLENQVLVFLSVLLLIWIFGSKNAANSEALEGILGILAKNLTSKGYGILLYIFKEIQDIWINSRDFLDFGVFCNIFLGIWVILKILKVILNTWAPIGGLNSVKLCVLACLGAQCIPLEWPKTELHPWTHTGESP